MARNCPEATAANEEYSPSVAKIQG